MRYARAVVADPQAEVRCCARVVPRQARKEGALCVSVWRSRKAVECVGARAPLVSPTRCALRGRRCQERGPIGLWDARSVSVWTGSLKLRVLVVVRTITDDGRGSERLHPEQAEARKEVERQYKGVTFRHAPFILQTTKLHSTLTHTQPSVAPPPSTSHPSGPPSLARGKQARGHTLDAGRSFRAAAVAPARR